MPLSDREQCAAIFVKAHETLHRAGLSRTPEEITAGLDALALCVADLATILGDHLENPVEAH